MSPPKAPRLSWSTLRNLARAAAYPRALLGRRIGKALREQIIVHVSAVNDCAICAAAHTAAGRVAGVPGQTLARARRQELPEDARTRAALRYAELRTQGLEDRSPEAREELELHFDSEEQREIRGIADAFTFANRFNNTWESRVPGAEIRRRWLGMRPADGEDGGSDDADP